MNNKEFQDYLSTITKVFCTALIISFVVVVIKNLLVLFGS